jgi:hypothetical protein
MALNMLFQGHYAVISGRTSRVDEKGFAFEATGRTLRGY